jgi:hypothetical protein
MTVIGALSSFRKLGEMGPHKRAWGMSMSRSNSVLETWTLADFWGVIFGE